MERLLNLELTSACNANCSMCPRDKVKEIGYISLDMIDSVIKKVENYNLFEVSLSGRGEPTFHPNLIEILRKLRKLQAPISLVTTTDGLDEKNYKEVVDNLDILRISVSSIIPKDFLKIHRGLDYNKIWTNIKNLVEYKSEKINIHLVGGEAMYDSLEDTIKFFKNYNINSIYLLPLWNRGGAVEKQETLHIRNTLVEKYNIFYSEDEYFDDKKVKMLELENYCPLGDTSIAINYKGEMIGCFQDFGNITKICNVIENNDFIKERRKKLKQMPVCKKCNSALVVRT